MHSVAVVETKNNLFPTLPTYQGLSPDMQKQVDKSVYIDTLKEQCLLQKKEEALDIERYKKGWFQNMAKNTRRMYGNALDRFLSYSQNKVLSITAVDADNFVIYLKTLLPSESSVRSYYRGVSSFFSYLERDEIINRNPFRGCKIKLNIKPKDKYVPSDEEIIAVENYAIPKYSVETFIKLRMGIHLMQHYGVRVDFLTGMVLDGDVITSTSKGKEHKIYLDDEIEVEYYTKNKEILENLNSNSISTWFNVCVKELHEAGEIGGRFSPHCLRHYYATKFYREYTGAGDRMTELAKRMGHTDTKTTAIYLRSLGLVN